MKDCFSPFTALFTAILYCLICLNFNDSIITTYNKYITPVSKEKFIYFDSSLSTEEVLLSIEAAKHWENSTNNLIKFHYKLNADDKDIIFANSKAAILITKVLRTEKSKYFNFNKDRTTLAFYTERTNIPAIVLIPERADDEDSYRATIIHELGHAIGLEHNYVDGTIMYPYSNELSPNYLVKEDIAHFCKTYFCNPTALPRN